MVRALAADFAEGLLQLLFPQHCILCEQFGDDWLCPDCVKLVIDPVPQPYCLRCGQTLVAESCFKCADYPSGLIRCRAVAIHHGTLAGLIHQLKYRDKPMLAGPLAGAMADYLTIRAEIFAGLRFNSIVPVPLHPKRQRTRGYNQSARLAEGIAAQLGIPVVSRALSRTIHTRQQVGMARSGRMENLKGAFTADPVYCVGRSILLVDDVMTTGSTFDECAEVLLAAGASSVYAIALAAG